MAGPLSLLLLALAGCAAPLQGVVEAGGASTHLTDQDGRRYRLVLNEYSAPVSHLDRCTVELTGPRVGRVMGVHGWEVLAAADGSAPFVGRIDEHGSNVLLNDRASGSTFILDGALAEELRAYDGQLVMVIGFVVGPQTLRVMGAEVLED
ncbi:MAG: hypothetical protein H6741_19695 [Alphaproteobacteria bacterium]|nr:hypothetical protein [Alphaproteobacteria bacterium]MCB9794929.1 hypothetical protein [Alphaproteobacteria bacterium]